MKLLALIALLCAAQSSDTVDCRYTDVPPPLRSHIPASPSDFDAYLAKLDRDSRNRIAAGEDEALAYFVLQSSAFTKAPPVEPALSAREYFANGEKLPQTVVRRFDDFLRALEHPSHDPRMQYFQRALPKAARTRSHLESAYRLAAEFARRPDYASRGYSSDTRLAAGFTVWNALSVLKTISPDLKLRRVLIVGPGADFAPRTDFHDDPPPQSYQPIATADALLELGLAAAGKLEIVCADVNERVLETVRATRRLRITPEPGSAEFVSYQQRLSAAPVPRAAIIPQRLNIVTERLAGQPFDLVIATNVLLYFPPPELALALVNIQAIMRTGGFFIHNDVQPQAELYTKEMGLNWVQARRILIAQGAKAPLYDTFSILKK